MAESGSKWMLTWVSLVSAWGSWWLCSERNKKRLISFSYVVLSHSAAMLKVRFWFNWNLSPRCSAIQSHSELWVCACCCSLFIASIGRTLFHTFRTLPGPFFFLCLSLPFCHSVFHQFTRWCTTVWGHGRWSGNLLSALCSPPSTTQALDLLSCRLWTQKESVSRRCVCAHVCSLYFPLLCCMWCNCGQ